MAKKRPDFNLPSTSGASEPAPKTEWVYRTDAHVTRAPGVTRIPPVATDAPSGYDIVDLYSRLGAAAGIVPLPMLDLVAVSVLQLKMIAALAERYGVPFNREVGKSLLAAVIGTAAPLRIASSFVPILGIATRPALGYASTWAVGRVFVNHFESGGTLADADGEKLKKDFQQLRGAH